MALPRVSRLVLQVVVAALALAAGLQVTTLARQAAGPAGSASVSGRLVILNNGQPTPVRRARVTLTGGATGSQALIADSDIDGRYRFDRVAAGTYRLTAAKPGFITTGTAAMAAAEPGTSLRLNAGESATHDIVMEHAAAIEGRLIDATGEPAINIVVKAVRVAADGSGAPPITVQQVRTDDLGRYRLHTLPPGEYAIDASLDPRDVGRVPTASHTFYPGAARVEEAQRVTTSSARDTTGIDFALIQTPTAPTPSATSPSSGALGAVAAIARPDTPPQGTGRIAGRVTRADGGRPLGGAAIRIVRWEGGSGTQKSIRADEQGRFEFPALTAGSYQLTFSADGFLDREFGWSAATPTGRRIDLGNNEQFIQANVAMPRPSAVEGRLLDEFGDPAPGVLVQIATVQFIAGARRLLPASGRIAPRPTDDLGQFRIFGLPPDDYYVMALSGAFATETDLAGFAPTFYPGTRIATDAQALHVDIAKDVVNTTFPLVPAGMSTVTGVVVDADGAPLPQASVLLMQTNGGDVRLMVLARGASGADGTFSFRNVAEGRYAIQAFGRLTSGGPPGRAPFGSIEFDAAPAATAPLRVAVRTGATLRGRAIFSGDGPRPARGDVRVSGGPINFISSPVIGSGPPEQVWADDDTFEVRNLSGVLSLRADARPDMWTVSRMTLAGRDVTDTPIDFRQGDIDGLEITFTNRAPSVSGSVMDGDKPAADYGVILFAADPTKWTFPSRYIMLGRPNQQGGFKIAGVPPGAYLAVAVARVPSSGWQDPVYLQTLRGAATPVSVAEGDARTLTLKLAK